MGLQGVKFKGGALAALVLATSLFAAAPAAAVKHTGVDRRAVLLCRFQDAGLPSPSLHDKAYFEGMFGGGKGLKAYFDEASYGKLKFQPTVYDWKTIGPRSDYGIDGNTSTQTTLNQQAIFEACTSAHNEVDYSKVDGIDMIFNEDSDFGPSLGGAIPESAGGVSRIWPETMVPSSADSNDETLWAHEIGHSLGLPHSVGEGGRSHGWDPMNFTCGYGFFTGQFDPNYQCIPQYYLAAYRDSDWLGWIPKARRVVFKPQRKPSKATRNIDLERVAQPKSNGRALIARFPVGGKPATYYTAEARMAAGNFDSALNLQGDGVLVTKVVPKCQGTPQCRFDYVPAEVQGHDHDGNGMIDQNSIYTKGEAFKKGKLKIKVTRKYADGFRIRVTNRR